jgi:hypothetical protein
MTSRALLAAAGINTYNERSLHAAVKRWISQPGDLLEFLVDGYFIDVVQGDLLIEVQTANFGAIRDKLTDLCCRHPVRLVHPIAAEKWIVTRAADGIGPEKRRKSPRRGRVEDLFREMVHLPALMKDENFSLEVLLTREEEVRRPAPPRGRWRKGWVREERRLVEVLDRHVFRTPADLGALLPPNLVDPLTSRDVADISGWPVWLAQKLVYSLREMGVFRPAGKRGRAVLYTRG